MLQVARAAEEWTARFAVAIFPSAVIAKLTKTNGSFEFFF